MRIHITASKSSLKKVLISPGASLLLSRRNQSALRDYIHRSPAFKGNIKEGSDITIKMAGYKGPWCDTESHISNRSRILNFISGRISDIRGEYPSVYRISRMNSLGCRKEGRISVLSLISCQWFRFAST